MPLTDIGSYVTVLDEIAAHWLSVNTELGGAPATDLKLQGAFARADLIALRDQLNTVIIAEEDLENAREIASANRDTLKATLWQRLGQFRAVIETNGERGMSDHCFQHLGFSQATRFEMVRSVI